MHIDRPIRIALFLAGALLWLPIALILQSLVRFGPEFFGQPMIGEMILSTIAPAPFGLPLALACACLWRHGFRKTAILSFVLLAPLSLVGIVVGGLLGLPGMTLISLLLSLPAWAIFSISLFLSKRRARRSTKMIDNSPG
ncbi:hypothetical protein [Thioalkalivibrio sp. HK1]|uniref:hypothetical protein n=1 Tax=Thioalkalivibrio sp. HK1 TaxID=1469245 RepID=UPI0012DD85AA|nr:hypothetical protein [Thioalkalivibrio sp. HK1]